VSGPNQLPDGSENLAKAANRPARLGEQLSTFLEWLKPYKEIAILLVGLFSAISAGIAWTVSRFATQSALSSLECRISHDNGTKALADGAAATDTAVGLRHAEVRVLLTEQQSPTNSAIINQLLADADAINSAYAKDAAKSAQKINDAFAACLRAISSGKSETQP
jgi:hypothetical protein